MNQKGQFLLNAAMYKILSLHHKYYEQFYILMFFSCMLLDFLLTPFLPPPSAPRRRNNYNTRVGVSRYVVNTTATSQC